MNEQAMKFRFGIFVLAILILLAVLTILFGGVPGFFTPHDMYTVVVDNAQNVTRGTPVRRSGVTVGEVRSVDLDSTTGKVNLGVQVEHGFVIRMGDRPTILRGLLGGDVSLDVVPPEHPKAADLETVPVGSTLVGYVPPEAPELVQKTGELIQPAKASLGEMEKVLGKIDKLLPLFEDTLRSFRELAGSTNRLVPALGKTNDELRALTKSVRETVPDLKKSSDEFQLTARVWGRLGERLDVMVQTNEAKVGKTLDQLADVTKRLSQVISEENQKNLNLTLKNAADSTGRLTQMLSDDNMKNVNQTLRNARAASDQFESISKNTDDMIKDARVTIKNLNSTVIKADEVFGNLQKITGQFSSGSPNLMKNLDESSTTLNQTLRDLRELMREFARSDGTLQKLMTDPALYNNLNESASMVTKLLPRLDRILGDVEIFSDKLARHPELIGIGGMVRPSNGLKDAPSVLPWREPTEPRWRIWPH